jgi:hypothetical protein
VSLCARGNVYRDLDREELTRRLKALHAQNDPIELPEPQSATELGKV